MTEGDIKSAAQRGRRYAAERVVEIWNNLQRNNLWKRILKNVIATTLLVSIALIPGSKKAIGKAAYLGAIATVFGHPGRRFGQLAEALILVVSGAALGVAWSIFGVYLGSLVIDKYPPAAYAIRGFFLAVVALLHGFLRSRTPRLFLFVLLMIIVSVVTLTSTAKVVTALSATQTLYPILLAAGLIILINLCIFPEFSSRFLGQMAIDTLNDTANVLDNAGQYFVEAQSENMLAGKATSEGSERSGKNNFEESKPPETAGTGSSRASFVTKVWTSLRVFLFGKAFDPEDSSVDTRTSLISLTSSKAKIRKKLGECKSAQQECNFEIAFSVLPPQDVKPISVTAMKRFVANTIAVVSACESKFALLGSDQDEDAGNTGKGEIQSPAEHAKYEKYVQDPHRTGETTGHFGTSELHDDESKQRRLSTIIDQDKAELDMIKPKREIEFGDARLLRYLLRRATKPYTDLHRVCARMIEVVSACVAYAYDVPTLPSGARVPKGVIVEEVDVHLSTLQQALLRFDSDVASALEGAAAMQELEGLEPDIMPREEVFLISSFMLNVRQAVTHVEDMLKYSRGLVERRNQRQGRRRIYPPHIKWSKWLYSGGAEDEAMPTPARKANREGSSDALDDDEDEAKSMESNRPLLDNPDQNDIEKAANPHVPSGATSKKQMSKPKMTDSNGTAPFEKSSFGLRLRGQAADALEWVQSSEDVLYAMKLAVALFLVLWPAFVASWNQWYSLNRGLWAALQLVLITEVSIGTSVMTFFLRGIGTTLGCLWGYFAIEARNGNRIVCAVVIFVGLFPCAYVQLGTKYPKAGMVCIVSICVVALSAELETVPGTATQDYLKRWIAFMIGGSVALLVEVTLLPVKARTRLVESLATTLRQISEMEKCIASGIESGEKIDIYSPASVTRFEHTSTKANAALSAAETFLPFCSHEPRIKGSFEALALIYGEIISVLHQIVDRMDNMLQLRTAYGSGPLEDLNAEIYPYRRNVAGCITLTLFAIHAALTTKLPLPQYLPSARLAHLRMINRVREVVLEQVSSGQEDQDVIAQLARQRAVRRKYMSWNAASAAQAEIIEFLEELCDLTKLLVGANEFRSGLLTRPSYRDYVGEEEKGEGEVGEEGRDEFKERPAEMAAVPKRSAGTLSPRDSPLASPGFSRRRRGATVSSMNSGGEDVPASLRRIQSRKIEAGVRRQRTNESWNAQQQQL